MPKPKPVELRPKTAESAPAPEAPDRADWAIGAAVAGVAATLYGATAARDLVLGDTPDLMTAAATLGVPHPPGYPLFTLLGHLFSLVPLGSVPFRINLLAVASGVGTVLLVYLTALRLSRSRNAAACAALVLATIPLFWSWSLVAEVFALNNLLASALIYLLAIWHDWPKRTAWLSGAALAGGLALTNHQTIVLLGPAVLFLLARQRRLLLARPRDLRTAAGAFVLGLLPLLYLPWAASRQPAWNWGDPSSFASFLAVVMRKYYGSGQLTNDFHNQGGSPLDRLAAMGASLGLLAGVLVVLGALQAWRRQRWYFWFSMLAFTFAGPAFLAYADMNVSIPLLRSILERFFLLDYVALAPLMALGVLLAAEWLAASVPGIRARAVECVAAVVVLVALAGAAGHYAAIDQSANHTARRFAEDILATLEPNSILVANGDEVFMPLVYLLNVEHYRSDVSLVVLPLLQTDWYVQQLRRQYPNLTIPFARYDGRSGTLRALVEANAGRPIAVDGVEPDASLKDRFWFCRRGLVSAVLPVAAGVSLEAMVADTDHLFSRYRLPEPAGIKATSMDMMIPDHYAAPAIFIGRQLQQFGQNEKAHSWYQRAVSFHPSPAMLAQMPPQP